MSMNEEKLRKAFAAIKVDMDKTKSQLEKIEKNVHKKPQKDKEIDQILSILQSLKAETYENTKRVEALNTVVNPNTSKQESKSYQKDIDMLSKRIKELEVKPPLFPQKNEPVLPVNEQKIENTFNEFSEIMNEKMQIEMNSLRLEFTEEIAKLYDKCFNEIISLKADMEKDRRKEKKSSSPRSISAKSKPSTQEEVKQKESKLKKISKFLFVDEDEDDLKSVKKQVEDKSQK